MHHSSTYGNLRKERKFARQLYIGIVLTIAAAMVLVYVISQMRALYPYLPDTAPAESSSPNDFPPDKTREPTGQPKQ
jgi:hypothetical protein